MDIKDFLYKYFDADLHPISVASIILQLIFISWLVYQVYMRFRGTQAERVLRGLILLTPLIIICYILKLSIVTKLFEIFSSTILIGLIVIFAPEFRRVLMQIGSEFSILQYHYIPESKKQINDAIHEIAEAVKDLQAHKLGALIAIEKAKVDRYYINPGYKINANISKELLLTIFSPRSPLHDGAVTIRGTTIMAAGVILPMTENPKLDWQYGTRHRAAIGFTEVTESLCIVVSEETGDLSIANQGKLHKYDSHEGLQKQIEKFYSYLYKSKKRNKNINQYLNDIFKLKRSSQEP